jgi:hypothetical protein
MVTHVEEAGIAVATNGVAGRFFLSSTEANGYLRTHCLLPTYMIARCGARRGLCDSIA